MELGTALLCLFHEWHQPKRPPTNQRTLKDLCLFQADSLKIKPQDLNVRLTTALGAKAATDEAERANRRTLIVA